MLVLTFKTSVYSYMDHVFFFQAEDGIRDLVRSRGLGDVYKRQGIGHAEDDDALVGVLLPGAFQHRRLVAALDAPGAVSYTHLTLPTIYSV